jgi:hypothetical protein
MITPASITRDVVFDQQSKAIPTPQLGFDEKALCRCQSPVIDYDLGEVALEPESRYRSEVA